VVVLSDEIHCDFVSKGHKYTPFSTLENRDIVNNSLTFKSASKSFGLSAMHCAWFFTTNPDYFKGVSANNRADLSTLSMIADRAAYAGGEEWLDQLVPYIDGNHAFAESFIRANIPTIKYAKAEATYLAWIDISGVIEKIGAKEMAAEANRKNGSQITPEQMVERYLAANAKVQINAGNGYGVGGAGHMRMNIATSRKTLELALTAVASTLKKA
jgi:cystathionine beta-lyase